MTPWTACSPPGSSVHGISQAGILEWVPISFSRWPSQIRDWTLGLLHYRRILYCMSYQRSQQGCWIKTLPSGVTERVTWANLCQCFTHCLVGVQTAVLDTVLRCLDLKVRWQITVLCNVLVASGYENIREIYRHADYAQMISGRIHMWLSQKGSLERKQKARDWDQRDSCKFMIKDFI